jgi:hypothetical protein
MLSGSKVQLAKAIPSCLIKKSVFGAGLVKIFPLLLPIGLVASDLQPGPD